MSYFYLLVCIDYRVYVCSGLYIALIKIYVVRDISIPPNESRGHPSGPTKVILIDTLYEYNLLDVRLILSI